MTYITQPGQSLTRAGKFIWRPVVDKDKVIGVVCDHFQTTFDQINVKNRKRELVYTRQVLCYFLKLFSFPNNLTVSEVFGKHDHTYTAAAVKKIEDLMWSDPAIKSEIKDLYNRILEQ